VCAWALPGGAGGGAGAGGESFLRFYRCVTDVPRWRFVSFRVFLLAFRTSSFDSSFFLCLPLFSLFGFHPSYQVKFLSRNRHCLSVLFHLALSSLFLIPSSQFPMLPFLFQRDRYRSSGSFLLFYSRGWRNVDFGYTVTLQIRAPSAYPPPTTPQKRQFSDFLCQKHTQSGNTLHFLSF
jgi:hypothetical protein